MRPRRFGCTSGQNTFRVITRLPVELQSSRLVHLDQRDDSYVPARRELHPPTASCGVDVRSLVLYFCVAPSRLHPKARTKHGWRCKHMDVHPRILVAFQAYPPEVGGIREYRIREYGIQNTEYANTEYANTEYTNTSYANRESANMRSAKSPGESATGPTLCRSARIPLPRVYGGASRPPAPYYVPPLCHNFSNIKTSC